MSINANLAIVMLANAAIEHLPSKFMPPKMDPRLCGGDEPDKGHIK
jgi:hypothetical protein